MGSRIQGLDPEPPISPTLSTAHCPTGPRPMAAQQSQRPERVSLGMPSLGNSRGPGPRGATRVLGSYQKGCSSGPLWGCAGVTRAPLRVCAVEQSPTAARGAASGGCLCPKTLCGQNRAQVWLLRVTCEADGYGARQRQGQGLTGLDRFTVSHQYQLRCMADFQSPA